MSATGIGGRTLGGLCVALAVLGGACTNGSENGADHTASTTTLPDDQKPPLLRESWTPDDLARLAEIEVSDYEDEQIELTDGALVREFVSDPDPEGTTLTVRVRLAPCTAATCWDLAQEPPPDQVAALRSQLPTAAQDDPDLVLEYGSADLVGDFEGFGLYYRSFQPDGDDSAIGYRALYHDGLNLMEATVTPTATSDPTDDEALEAQMPEEWAQEVTADVFAAFADEFNVDG